MNGTADVSDDGGRVRGDRRTADVLIPRIVGREKLLAQERKHAAAFELLDLQGLAAAQ